MNEQLQREPVSRPGEPTTAPPGSAGKIRVLTERASRREALFHPKDNLKRVLPNPREEVEVLPIPDVEVEVEDVEEEAEVDEPCETELVS
jgi:hypothetical protein